MGHPVNWFEIVGSDGATLQQCYADLFGWRKIGLFKAQTSVGGLRLHPCKS